MDSIVQIIKTLDDEDVKEFVRFATKSSSKNQKLLLKLFDEFRNKSNVSKEDVMQALYGAQKYEAYKGLRKRLLALLHRFISLKLIDKDSSNTSLIISLVNMGRYLKGHSEPELAYKYFKKAEQQAEANDLYEVINSIYMLLIEFGLPQDEKGFNNVVEKWKRNKIRLERSESAEVAIQLITRQLLAGEEQVSEIFEETIEGLQEADDFSTEPRFVYQVASLYRKQLLGQKDFVGLKVFLEKQFDKINESGRDLKGNYYYVALLYMMAHMAFRNKDFEVSLRRTEELSSAINHLAPIKRKEFDVKVSLLRAANTLYLGQLEKSIDLYAKAGDEKIFQINEKANINRIMSYAVALALKRQFRKAKLELLKIQRNDQWLIKKFGQEWLLKKSMIEALLFYELNDLSLLDSKLRYIKTKFNSLLKKKIYNRALVFVKFIEKIDVVDTDELQALVETSFDWQPYSQDDLQAITYYAWLKGKLQKQDTYQVLMSFSQIQNDISDE